MTFRVSIKFHNPTADLYVPDGTEIDEALARTTHLGIGAHQDDLEIMAFHGIAECFGRKDRWFTGVTCADGAGSPRPEKYSRFTTDELRRTRMEEQRKAAKIGQYSAMIQLDHLSSQVRDRRFRWVQEDLSSVLFQMKPKVLYTHNPADRHETHVAVFVRCIEAIRELPPKHRPKKIFGCEVWRSLDWVSDEDRVALDVSGHRNLARKLLRVFASQISGGKRYDLAALARWKSNATFSESHAVDRAEELIFALDLTRLVNSPSTDLTGFVLEHVRRIEADIRKKLRSVLR